MVRPLTAISSGQRQAAGISPLKEILARAGGKMKRERLKTRTMQKAKKKKKQQKSKGEIRGLETLRRKGRGGGKKRKEKNPRRGRCQDLACLTGGAERVHALPLLPQWGAHRQAPPPFGF